MQLYQCSGIKSSRKVVSRFRPVLADPSPYSAGTSRLLLLPVGPSAVLSRPTHTPGYTVMPTNQPASASNPAIRASSHNASTGTSTVQFQIKVLSTGKVTVRVQVYIQSAIPPVQQHGLGSAGRAAESLYSTY